MKYFSNAPMNLEEDLCKNINKLVPEKRRITLRLKDFTVPYMSLISIGMIVDWEVIGNILLKKYNIVHIAVKNGTDGLKHIFYRQII